MGFIKRHYERILLGAVLLGLAVGVALLPFKIDSEKKDLKELIDPKLAGKPKSLDPVDEARFSAVYGRLEKPTPVNFSRPHNLFNPVQWQRKPDGTLIKVANDNTIGPGALVITKMNPLFTTVSFESAGASGSNYFVSVTRDAAIKRADRGKQSFSIEIGAKGNFMSLQEVKGAPEKPELVLVLADTGAKITVSADSPFQRVDGYSVDVKYDPEKRTWLNRRVNDKLMFYGDEFTIVAINQVATNQFEVVVSAKSTGKKTTRPFTSDVQP
jgi:hypothetical protein